MNNLQNILIQAGITLSLMVGSYFYGQHRQYISDKVETQKHIISNQQTAISKMENANKISQETIFDLYNIIGKQNESYTKVINKLQNDNDIVTNKLNSTNRVNGLLVRSIQLGINGEAVSSNSITSSGTYGTTTTYKPADLVAGISDLGRQCNSIRTYYMKLQEWNRQQVENYNK